MKVVDTSDIRNLVLMGHGATGKTSLASAMLYVAGAVNRVGKTDDGTTTTDFDEEEIERKLSLQCALAHLSWKSKKVNLIDTPGFAAFIADAIAGAAVADAAAILVEGVSGLQVVTPRVFRFAEARELPVIFVVNKLDRERASFDRCVEQIQERFGREAIPMQLPFGAEAEFSGVVDLLQMKVLRNADDSGKPKVEDVPPELAERAAEARATLVEMVAETDEKLMETFFEAGDLEGQVLLDGLRRGVTQRKIFPIMATAATGLIGVSAFLDAVVDVTPAPGERGPARGTNPADGSEIERPVDKDQPAAIFVFKSLADPFAGRLSLFRVACGTVRGDSSLVNLTNDSTERLGHVHVMQGKQPEQVDELRAGDLGVVTKLKDTHTNDTLCDAAAPFAIPAMEFPEPSISYAVVPKSKGDEEKISGALARITEEDPVLSVGRDSQTHELLVSGTGQVHVEVAVAKMKKRFGVDALLKQPKIPYLESIVKKVGPIEGKHKKQSGGRGQFGVCVIEMEPLQRGSGFEFVDKIFGGSIPQNYRPAVKKGIQESAAKGVIAGYPVVDFRVTLLDGKYHNVDSSEMAFKIAGSLAFKDGVKQARPTLLEPIMSVEITAPEEFMGDIMGDLSSRRGKPQGMEPQGHYQVIKAEVPMSEMLTYASTLKSITSDRGSYHMEFNHYDPVPAQIQEQIVAEAGKGREQEA